MKVRRGGYAFLPVLQVGVPLTLAIVELIHPQPHNLMHLDTRTWLTVHYLQIPLFPLTALAAGFLLRGRTGFLSVLVWASMFVFAVSYTAFDTAAGVVTGILVKEAQSSGSPDLWWPAMNAIWTHPIVGGAPGTTPLLAVLGSIAWSVGLVGIAIDRWRGSSSLLTSILLFVSAFALSMFKTHAWPGGPVSFGALAVAAGLLQWGERRSEALE